MQPIIAGQGHASFAEAALPQGTGHCGVLHGANALHLMGKAAFACAAGHARCAVVMAKADGIEFARPIAPGSNIGIRAHVAFQGRSSMTVIVEIVPEHPADEVATPAITGRFMMVAVDGEGRPVPIPVSDQRAKEELRP